MRRSQRLATAAVASGDGGKRVVVVSSSSSEDLEEQEEYDGEDGDDDDGEEDSSSDWGEDDADDSDYDKDDEDWGEEEKVEEDEADGGGSVDGKPTSEHLYAKVIDLLRRQISLEALKLEECKAYLRKHALRLSGTKLTCIERIMEHWRLKDGNGEKLHPQSSFSINCTGDVCKGDVILFSQKVYDKFDKVTRGANVIGRRRIAGKVVKESYGAFKQQHTFTVEVLWCRGMKALPPLFPLLVKGRNLYKLKTFRQRWEDEVERLKILEEKHRRGAAARRTRDIRKERSSGLRGQKRDSNSGRVRNQKEKELKNVSKKRKYNNASSNIQSNADEKMKQVHNNREMKHPQCDGRRTGQHAPDANMRIVNSSERYLSQYSSESYPRQVSYPHQQRNNQHNFPQSNHFHGNGNATRHLQQTNYTAHSNSTNYGIPASSYAHSNSSNYGIPASSYAYGHIENPAFNVVPFHSYHFRPPNVGLGPILSPGWQFERWRRP